MTRSYRTCPACGRSRPHADFDGLSTRCRRCVTVHVDLAELNAPNGHQKRRETERRTTRDRYYQNTYGITVAQYEAMLESQGGGCALCQAKPSTHGVPLAVDHDHQTGEVRGILCMGCNTSLGGLGDSVVSLRRALHYLESPPSRHVMPLREPDPPSDVAIR